MYILKFKHLEQVCTLKRNSCIFQSKKNFKGSYLEALSNKPNIRISDLDNQNCIYYKGKKKFVYKRIYVKNIQ